MTGAEFKKFAKTLDITTRYKMEGEVIRDIFCKEDLDETISEIRERFYKKYSGK
jgi:hypothetical protein